jgi:hypothetical protein
MVSSVGNSPSIPDRFFEPGGRLRTISGNFRYKIKLNKKQTNKKQKLKNIRHQNPDRFRSEGRPDVQLFWQLNPHQQITWQLVASTLFF